MNFLLSFIMGLPRLHYFLIIPPLGIRYFLIIGEARREVPPNHAQPPKALLYYTISIISIKSYIGGYIGFSGDARREP